MKLTRIYLLTIMRRWQLKKAFKFSISSKLFFKQLTGLPGGAEEREEIAVQSIPAGDAPCQDQKQFDEEHKGIGADCAGEQIIHVHKSTEECRDSCKNAENQCNADQEFAVCDEVRKQNGMLQDK